MSCGGGGGGGETDTMPPTVSSTDPADDATGVPTDLIGITATFSESMTRATLTTSTFLVSNASGTISGSVSYHDPTRIAVFTPSTAFMSSTTYTVTITTRVKDAAGNAMAENKTWSFTTASYELWQTTSTANAPSARRYHTAVWTGQKMLVWGGYDGHCGKYRVCV